MVALVVWLFRRLLARPCVELEEAGLAEEGAVCLGKVLVLDNVWDGEEEMEVVEVAARRVLPAEPVIVETKGSKPNCEMLTLTWNVVVVARLGR